VFQFTFSCGISDEVRDCEKSREKVVGHSGEKDESRVPEQIRGEGREPGREIVREKDGSRDLFDFCLD
jgi:hypothetical protein